MLRPSRSAGPNPPMTSWHPSSASAAARSTPTQHVHRNFRIGTLVRHDTRNCLSPEPSVNAKVGIGGQQHRVGERLGHAHEAGVGEAHWHVNIFFHQVEDLSCALVQPESADYGASPKQARKERRIHPKKMKCFRPYRLACFPRRWKPTCVSGRPSMVTVAFREEGNQKAGVSEDACGHSQ